MPAPESPAAALSAAVERAERAQLAFIEGLAKIAKEYRLDALKVGDVTIARSQHEPLPAPKGEAAADEDDDEHEFPGEFR